MLNKNMRGFTIIEVVIVLAIAGLIFLIVFLALPQLQAARRDSQRKTDMARLIALLETYHGNTGQLPNTTSQINLFLAGYIDTVTLADPQEGSYDIIGIEAADLGGHDLYPTLGQVYFKAGHVCKPDRGGPGTDQIQHAGAISTSIAVWTHLENAGSYCADNGIQG